MDLAALYVSGFHLVSKTARVESPALVLLM
jgi:hypothetical protein